LNLLRAVATIGSLTLVSRVAGFVRDMLMARFVGAGLAADAFLIAWRLPNLFRALFAEGAFAAAFVPMFNRVMAENEDDGRSAAIRFSENVLSILLPFLIIFTAVMMIAAAPIVRGMTGGFPDGGPGKFALTVELTRITFPYLMLISLVSMLGGILNSFGRFWVNAAAPILLNLCLIVALLFFRGDSPEATARTQALAVTAAGVLQLAWLIWSCRRAGVVLKLRRPTLSPQVKRLLVIIGPAAIGAGAVQFNLLISTSLAARFLQEGAVSYLYYADRLNQLPLGIIGIGVGTAILPTLSRQIGGGEPAKAAATQNRAVELALLLTVPAAAALVVSATPLIRALLQHGAFSDADTIGSAAALSAFALGLPAYVLIKVLTPGFYARSDTKAPVRIALAAMLVNLIGNLILIWPLGHVGLALSTAFAAWVNVALLYIVLVRRGHFSVDSRLLGRLWRIAVAAGVMAAVLVALNPLLDLAATRGVLERALSIAALVGAGALSYAVVALMLRAVSLGELRAQFGRRSK